MAENDGLESRPGEPEPQEPGADADAETDAQTGPRRIPEAGPQLPAPGGEPAGYAGPTAAPPPGYAAPGGQPGFGYASYPPPAPPRPKAPPLIRLNELLPAALDAVVPLAAGLVVAVLGLLLVVGAGLSGISVQGAGAADYFATACWLTASSLGTPFGGGFTQSFSLGGDGFGSDGFSATESISARATVWLITALILFLVFRAARGRERRAGSRTLAQLVARSLVAALFSSVVLMILAITTQRPGVFGTGALFDGESDPANGLGVTQNGSLGIDTPLVFVGPLLLVLAAALAGRISVWMRSPETDDDPRARRARAQWARWLPSLRVAWLQTRVIVTLASVGLWFYVAFEAGTDSNASDHPLAFVLAAIVLILNLGVYGMFAGFGVSLYATASSLGGALGGNGDGGGTGSGAYGSNLSIASDGGNGNGYTLGIFGGDKPWGIWLLLAAVVLGTLTPALLTRLERGGKWKQAVRREDYAPAGAWRSAVLGLATALALVLLGALELNATFTEGSAFAGSFGFGASFGPSLLAAMGLTALWFLLAYMALSYALGHRVQWRGLAYRQQYPQQQYPQQFQQVYPQGQSPQAYQQPYPDMPMQGQAPGIEQLPPPAPPSQAEAAAPVPAESVAPVAPDERAGYVEPIDPSEPLEDVIFPDDGETLGEG